MPVGEVCPYCHRDQVSLLGASPTIYACRLCRSRWRGPLFWHRDDLTLAEFSAAATARRYKRTRRRRRP